MAETTEKKLDKKSRMAGIDIVSSLAVMAVSVAVVYWSLKMPRNLGWARAPGLVPILFGGSMFFMGLALFVSAVRNKGIPALRRMLSGLSYSAYVADVEAKRATWIILIVAVFLLGFTGRVPFEIAGSIFLFTTLAVFWRRGGWLRIILVSLLVPLAFSAMFHLFFKVLVPGGSIFDWFL